MALSPLMRFLVKVDMTGSCWNWKAAMHPQGYGKFADNGKPDRTHRVSWKLFNGPISGGAWVLHKCDNRRCVNPDHLYLGDRQQNINDMMARNRHRSVRITTCPKGHPYEGENIRWYHGKRTCRQCARAAARNYMKGRRARFTAAGLTTKGKPYKLKTPVIK